MGQLSDKTSEREAGSTQIVSTAMPLGLFK